MAGVISDEELAAWLRRTIEADLALARRLAARWVAPPGHPDAGAPIWPSSSVKALAVFRGVDPDVNAGLDLIRLCSPAYVVARCEAELAILDEHAGEADYPPESIAEHRARGWPEEQLAAMAGMVYCARCHMPVDDAREDESQCLGVIYPCRTVRLLASGYRHRPGYREEWAPTPGSAPSAAGQ